MAVNKRNLQGIVSGLSVWVLSVFLLGFTGGEPTDGPPLQIALADTSPQQNSSEEQARKPQENKTKLVNREDSPQLSQNFTAGDDSELNTVEGCQNAVLSILKEQPIEFLPGRHSLSRASIEIVKDIAVVLKDCEKVKVIISGHTDNRGTPETNQRLSGLRASSVMDAFIKTGVKQGRLRAVGFGDTKPLVPNDSPENEALNRRIELELY